MQGIRKYKEILLAEGRKCLKQNKAGSSKSCIHTFHSDKLRKHTQNTRPKNPALLANSPCTASPRTKPRRQAGRAKQQAEGTSCFDISFPFNVSLDCRKLLVDLPPCMHHHYSITVLDTDSIQPALIRRQHPFTLECSEGVLESLKAEADPGH